MQLRSGKRIGLGYTCNSCKEIIEGPVYIHNNCLGHHDCLWYVDYCKVINLPKFTSFEHGLLPYMKNIIDNKISISGKELSLIACLLENHNNFVGTHKIKMAIEKKSENKITFENIEALALRDTSIVVWALVNSVLPREIIKVIIQMVV